MGSAFIIVRNMAKVLLNNIWFALLVVANFVVAHNAFPTFPYLNS